jgi:hypothetical protein
MYIACESKARSDTNSYKYKIIFQSTFICTTNFLSSPQFSIIRLAKTGAEPFVFTCIEPSHHVIEATSTFKLTKSGLP